MAVFRGDIRSRVLGMDTGLHVILPYDRPAEPQREPCRVLYLLHGLGDNAAAWCRYTRLESYARDKGIAVVMPEVQRSFYFDMYHGMNYFTYLTVELPGLCNRMFGISGSREDTFAAGLSMGGYGALKCGLVCPDLFAGCASFSGAVDIVKILEDYGDNPEFQNDFRAVVGAELQLLDQDNLMVQAKRVSGLEKKRQPAILITCGTEDYLYANNLSFKEYLETISLAFTWREWPGKHNWAFWDESIRQALDFFFPEP